MAPATPAVALVHDYLTQRGGAERVVLELVRSFPGAPVYTSLYDPDGTFPEFAEVDVRPFPLNRLAVLRRHHRAALPVLAPVFSAQRIQAAVTICSSSGWAHGVRTSGSKLVYCYTPARWLYQQDRYLGQDARGATRAALGVLGPPLRAWDRRAARSGGRYLTSSSAVADRIRRAYGLEAEVVPPPPAVTPDGPERSVDDLDPGFLLCIARLLPYKNVDVVIDAIEGLPDARLVVVGDGPARAALEARSGDRVRFVGTVDDATLRWLYRHARLLVAASYEDYGLTPLEAATFGCPAVTLRFGGYLDTIAEGTTGLFFDHPTAASLAPALADALATSWDGGAVQAHAARYSAPAFRARMQRAVAELAATGSAGQAGG